MYLSRLILNPRCSQVRAELANPYEMHRTLLSGLADQRASAGMLHRCDIHRATGTPVVLVQSEAPPDWGHLAGAGRGEYLLAASDAGALGIAPEPLSNPQVKPLDLAGRLAPGQSLGFRLRANPTFRENATRRRLGVLGEEAQAAWLVRKGAACGFRVEQLTVVDEGFLSARKPSGESMRFLSVLFDGRLVVIEPTLLCEALRKGVGSAKAFGFGLLSLAPAR